MNEIEKLNERIAQLTDLVKSGEETISATKEMLKLAEQERDRLADQRRESEPKFERVEIRKPYWSVGMTPKAEPRCYREGFEYYEQFHRNCFDNNNYFHTEERAKEVANKINLLLKLERLHDIYCPNYVPDWRNCWLSKYYIYQDKSDKSMGNIWIYSAVSADSDAVQVYFPTEEIAKKVCDILNAELEEKK